MNQQQEAYIKGVAHSIEVYAETMRQCVQALQRHSLQDMPVELVELNFRDVAEPCQHIQRILSELLPYMPITEKLTCSSCHKPIEQLYTHTEGGVKRNYCSYCYLSQFD